MKQRTPPPHLLGIAIVLILLAMLAGCVEPLPNAEPDEPQRLQAASTYEGEPIFAADFALTTLDGQTLRLSEMRGRWVLVNFWASWCPPCIKEMPLLQHLAEGERERLVVLGVNLRESRATVADFVGQMGVTYQILLAPDDATLVAYNVAGLPATTLVRPDGSVERLWYGEIKAEEVTALMDR